MAAAARGRSGPVPCVWLLLLVMAAGLPRGGAVGMKLPFSPRDVLPILPRQVAWPVMNTFHSAVDLLPSFVAAVAPGAPSPAAWNGSCFAQNEAALELTQGDRNGTEIGGAVLRLKTGSAQSWTCMDLYVFATPYRITWDYYFAAREHTLEITSWEEEAELEYVKQHGISVFLMPSGMLGTLLSLIDVLPLFSNTGWGQNSNLAFLEKHMGATFEKRSQPWVTNIRKEDIQSGDFLALSKIRGRWGGFETLEKWVTGAFAGHTAVCLKDEKGDLWVAESGYENEKGEEIIAIVPWDEWWEMALKDGSNPQIALLPLHPDIRSRFNESAAWDFARSMVGKPYGYHNMIFSWIDTIGDNYPPPLDANLVMTVMSMWTRLQHFMLQTCGMKPLRNDLGLRVWTFRVSLLRPKGVVCLLISCLPSLSKMNGYTVMVNQSLVFPSFLQCTRKLECLLLSQSRFRSPSSLYGTHICSRFSKTTMPGFQTGAVPRQTSPLSARSSGSTGWSCLGTTQWSHM